MAEVESVGKRQFSVAMDEDDIVELEKIARAKRSSVGQVIREFAVAGIERHRRIEALERVS